MAAKWEASVDAYGGKPTVNVQVWEVLTPAEARKLAEELIRLSAS